MPTDSTRPLARQMLAAVFRHAARDGPPDRDLLAKFAADRDEEAFAELVRRHGAMVLGVCRRVTGHPQDAEDAFQAAFLVLARRAGQVGRPELLGNWLYGVAYRTALEARGSARRAKEQSVSDVPEPAARDTGSPGGSDTADLRRVVDEELARLPEKYRAAVVLCDLEGLSRKDAATRLRVPEGTLSSRLAQARKLLAARLTRRGVTATAGAVAAALGRDAAAAVVPAPLVYLTARAAARVAAGGVVPPDLVSSRVSTLTDGAMKAMIANRLRLMTGAAVLAAGVLGLGAAAVVGQNPPRRAAEARYVPLIAAEASAAAQDKDKPDKEKVDKAKAPEKIPAKGIEDDDVPYPTFPAQAVVRLEDDNKLVIRQRAKSFTQTKRQGAGGGTVTAYELRAAVTGTTYDASDVSVFDMKGNRVPDKTWKERLKKDTHVLIAFDGRLPLPRELTLVKEDTLLIVLPTRSGVEIPPVVAPPGYRLRYYYEPSADGAGVTLPPLAGYAAPPTPTPAVPPAQTVPSRTAPSRPVPPPAPPAPEGAIPPAELPTNPGM